MVLVFYVPLRHQRLSHDKFNSYRGVFIIFLITLDSQDFHSIFPYGISDVFPSML
jgi:hypothetical protein